MAPVRLWAAEEPAHPGPAVLAEAVGEVSAVAAAAALEAVVAAVSAVAAGEASAAAVAAASAAAVEAASVEAAAADLADVAETVLYLKNSVVAGAWRVSLRVPVLFYVYLQRRTALLLCGMTAIWGVNGLICSKITT